MNGKRGQNYQNFDAYSNNYLNIEAIKQALDGKYKLLTDYLRYKNEYKLINFEIIDSSQYSKRVVPEANFPCLEIAQDFINHRDIDPSKMILKLSQVIYKTSHKLVPQEVPNNKKQRQVDLLLNNKPLLRFRFECSNNKIAGKATAYETINLLFPGVFSRLLLNILETVDEYDLAIFESKSKPGNQLEDMRKRKGDIYFKLFRSEMRCSILDRTGKLAGNTCNTQFAEQANFRERVKLKMFSTMANSILQKHAGRSLNFDVKLTNKISPENSLEGENKNEYTVNVVDNTAHKFMSATIICQNTKDAKNVCGLKFIELYAHPIFKKIWNIEMPDEYPVPPQEPGQDQEAAENPPLHSNSALSSTKPSSQEYSLYGNLNKHTQKIHTLTGVLSNNESEEEDHYEDPYQDDNLVQLSSQGNHHQYDAGNHIVDKSLKTLWEEDANEENDQYYYRPMASSKQQNFEERQDRQEEFVDDDQVCDVSKSFSVENSDAEAGSVQAASASPSDAHEKDCAEAWYCSVDKIFQDFLERKYNLKFTGDLSSFPPSLSEKMQDEFQGECIFSQALPARVNKALKSQGHRLEYFLISRDEFTKQHEVRFVLHREADQTSTNQILAYTQIKFSSNDLQHWQCVNYGIYLLMERCFPSVAKQIAAHWIRAKISALYLNRQECSCPDKDRLDEGAAAGLDPQDICSRSLLSGLSRDQSSSHHAAKTSQDHSTSLGKSQAKDQLDPNHLSSLKLIEQFALHKREPNLPEDQLAQVKQWGQIDVSILGDLKKKPFAQDNWQLESVLINYEQFKWLKKDEKSYEAAIKKKDAFYSNIKKSMLEEDYSSITNTFLHTIYKTDMSIKSRECYSVFSLSGNDVLIVKAQAQNSKLRTKLCSMIVLKLFWESLFIRCAEGDLSGRNP